MNFLRKYLIVIIFTIISIVGVFYFSFNFDMEKLAYCIVGVIVFPLFNPICKLVRLDLPLSLQYLFYFYIFGGLICGSSFGFYDLFSWWDLLLHGFFGVVACYVFYFIMAKVRLIKHMNVYTLIFLMISFTLACACMWEIFEFSADFLVGSDSQHVKDCMEKGQLPQHDTMTDMMISLVGALLTSILILIDKKHDYKVMKALYLDFKIKEKNIEEKK